MFSLNLMTGQVPEVYGVPRLYHRLCFCEAIRIIRELPSGRTRKQYREGREKTAELGHR